MELNGTTFLIAVILALIALFALAIYSTRIRMKRAFNSVIEAFHNQDAIDPARARTQAELGLSKRSFFSLKLLRDYKPMALQQLMQIQVVKYTEEGKLYLSEETLRTTNLGRE